jgi:hypothetical protein
MTKEQIKQYENLTTLKERAQFLLNIGVSAKINIVDLKLVMQACVGETMLPVTGDNEQDAIEKGIAWLKEKAA